ncbi:hypothetical protein [Enterovibrio norvegicus]|uniref:Uncharacterized protein n=1 Tax=Enterovibrio norvegicus TaxID=188144 RepID=A0A2N7L8S8_9GAMM|nr:hypothetical protein [Enterovibrio norvegicus]PMN90589.1 hypothetical protein BCT23_19415 [Enterovibrio norvegicus]
MNFDILIDTPEHTVDMKSGLDTMQGASEITRVIAGVLVSGKVPSRKDHKNPIRTNLKKSFKGSYGHTFSLDVYDKELKKKFDDIGSKVFSELMSYFFLAAIYEDTKPLSIAAKAKLDELGEDVADSLLDKLRQTPLKSLHQIPERFNYTVKLRYRENAHDQTILAEANRTTFLKLIPKPSNKVINISACITRFNINTGNGRLLVVGDKETIPFSINIPYRDVKLDTKKKFTRNLDDNNGIHDNDKRKYLTLPSKTIKTSNGKIVKYIVTGII